MFAAPPEIHAQILNASPNLVETKGSIDALDVLRWAMLQTCKDLQHHVSHWAQQGIEYARRHEADEQYKKNHDIAALRKRWTTPEARPLEEMYGVLSPEERSHKTTLTHRAFTIPELRKGLELMGIQTLEDPSMDEEQEREVTHEVEREEQVERPPKRNPAIHSIHPEVDSLIRNGVLPPGRSGILPLFHPFRNSSYGISDSWSPLLFASADFLSTIKEFPSDHLSDFMRPVNWILSGPDHVRVILSPYEVNELLPAIQDSPTLRLHVYAPRIALAMRSFSDLQFYTIPAPRKGGRRPEPLSTTQIQLDLFAGQLYFPSYQDYVSCCTTLGIFVPSGNESDLTIEVDSDGFVKPEHRGELSQHHAQYSNCNFKETPIPALKELVGRRRKGMSYLLTHVGQLLHGRSLTQNDFF
jgi:hypothetical protein